MLAFGALADLPIAAIPDEDRDATLGKFEQFLQIGTAKRIYLVEISPYQADES